jgi:outer membrane receptor for ferrienterochelin and colicin
MKNGFVLKRPSTSIGTIVNAALHEQQAYFGLNNYDGKEQYLNMNVIGQTFAFNTDHLFKGGFSYLYNDFRENFDSTSLNRTEHVPGIFTEYYYNLPDKFSVLAGARVDFHNLYGTFFTPRLHLKYNATTKTTIRVSAGKGFRTANVFAENTALLTSNRELIITEDLQPEEGWNYGLTWIQLFELNDREGIFTADFYRTDFVNQVVVNTDSSVHTIYVSNLHGDSYANTLQAELEYELFENFDIRFACKYVDAKSTYGSELLEVPLTYRNRGMANFAYTTKDQSWVFDFTLQYYGKSRLPDLSENHSAHHLGDYSEEYFLMLGQITKKFKWLELYFGSENIGNYTQHQPIIGYDEPFGEDFDASVIYAPIMKRSVYAGLRIIIK